MDSLETRIKNYVRDQGVQVVGIAGSNRLDGPPSLDPTYTLKGAKSVISMAIPMDVDAIDAFLSKESIVPHNLDQVAGNQRIFRVCRSLAQYIQSQGFRAREVPPNSTYRKSPDPFVSLQNASFSHRFAAMAAGIGAQGWSGNVMTKEYGAAIYLGSVVTDADLVSDPALPPRYFVDNYCVRCKRCTKTCPSQMFTGDEEEYILLNKQLHPRAKRNNVHLCTTTCFGLHALSPDKKWSTWGRHWIKEWEDGPSSPNNRARVMAAFIQAISTQGDSYPRYELIREYTAKLHSEEVIEEYMSAFDSLENDPEASRAISRIAREQMGIEGLRDPFAVTCSTCSLICSGDLQETSRRYRTLIKSGFAVSGPDGQRTRIASYEEAKAARKNRKNGVSLNQMRKDATSLTTAFTKYNFGIDPKSTMQGWLYERKLKKAVKKRLPGHREERV